MDAKATELLLHFGLTRQEAKIYILLLREGPLSGYEAAKRSGISRSNAYGCLAALVDKGAAYVLEEQAVQYQAVALHEFCENKLHFMKKTAQELENSLPMRRERNENYITIRGRRHVEDKFRNMLLHTKERVYLSASSKIIFLFQEELQDLIRGKKKVVLITDDSYELEGAIIYHAYRDETQIRLISDSSYALTGEVSDEWGTTCLYSENPNLVKLLKETLSNEMKLIRLGQDEKASTE